MLSLLEGFFACLYSLRIVQVLPLRTVIVNGSLDLTDRLASRLLRSWPTVLGFAPSNDCQRSINLPVTFIRRAVRKHRTPSAADPLPPTAEHGSLVDHRCVPAATALSYADLSNRSAAIVAARSDRSLSRGRTVPDPLSTTATEPAANVVAASARSLPFSLPLSEPVCTEDRPQFLGSADHRLGNPNRNRHSRLSDRRHRLKAPARRAFLSERRQRRHRKHPACQQKTLHNNLPNEEQNTNQS